MSTTTASWTSSYEKQHPHNPYQQSKEQAPHSHTATPSMNSDDEKSNALYATQIIQKLEQTDQS